MKTRGQLWLGCGCSLAIVLAGILGILTVAPPAARWLFFALVSFLAGLALWIQGEKLRLGRAFRARHRGEGKDALLVYSDSPHWGAHIEEGWLPRWGDRLVVLNRSRAWNPAGLDARLWRAVAGAAEHTPSVIIVSRHGWPGIIRFWRAFRDAKHGKDARLRELEEFLDAELRRAGP